MARKLIRLRTRDENYTCECVRGKKHREARLCKCIEERTKRLRYFLIRGGQSYPIPARIVKQAIKARRGR